MRKLLKNFTIVLTVAALGASLVGCGAKNSDNAGQSGSKTGTLKVLLPEDKGENDPLNIALGQWSEETGNKIEKIIISHDDQLTKFPAMAKNKDLPDLIATTRLHQLYPEEFVDMSTVVDTSLFEQSALKIVGQDYKSDKVTGLPRQFTTTSMFYNADALKAAGIEAPTMDNPWTWEQLYANAEKVQKTGATKYGFAADVSRARYDILMYANGGSIVEKDGDTFKVSVNSAQNVETLTKFVEANVKGIMPKAIWAGGSTDNPVEYFKNGDAAFLLSGSWNYNPISSEVTKFEFGVMPTPIGTSSQGAIIGGEALAVPEDAKNKELAKEFIKWFYTETNFKTYIQNDQGLSALNSVVYEPTDEKRVEDFKIIQGEVSNVTDSFRVDESSAWRTFKDNEYRDYIKRAVSGELTPQQALDSFAKELSESSNWEIAK